MLMLYLINNNNIRVMSSYEHVMIQNNNCEWGVTDDASCLFTINHHHHTLPYDLIKYLIISIYIFYIMYDSTI